jgi:hypothetical protein
MICIIPEGVYTMSAKRSIVKANARLYQKGRRKTKIKVLNELTQTLHYHRKHLAVLFRNTGKTTYAAQGLRLVGDPTVTYTHLRGRKKRYTQEIIPALVALWKLAHYCSSIHLIHFIRLNKDLIDQRWAYFKDLPRSIKERLFTISAATTDRLLKPIREQERLKHNYRVNVYGSTVKKRIPVQAFYDKPKGRVGYMELDLVHHCGVTTRGDYIHTLTACEINTDWTELRALHTRARKWAYQALKNIRQTVPFKITDFHVDNGSEFINAHVYYYTIEKGITLTRSRAYHKNDSPYVECRNWTMVRSYLGYRRYDTTAECAIIDQLLRLISLRHNYFIPTMKLKSKKRIGGKITKRYDIDLPVNRVLTSKEVSPEKKTELKRQRESLDYLDIYNRITNLQKKLDIFYQQKYTDFPKDMI